MSKEKLAPCPFCGADDAFVENLYGSTFAVQCGTCCAFGPSAEYSDHKFAKREAVSDWNKRATKQQGGAE
jgi:Lar family restriction alleviation protein